MTYHTLSVRVLLLCLLCISVGSLFVAVPVAAQEQNEELDSPISLQVAVGYDGHYRVSQWFPITVIASNDGPDVQGVLEWTFPGSGEEMTFQHTIDLPQGARKRISMYALSNGFLRSGELRLRSGSETLQLVSSRLTPLEAERLVIGVVSNDTTLLNSLVAISPVSRSGTSVVHIDPATLPETAVALGGINALFIHDITTADLDPAQQTALGLWTQLGGTLIVGGGIQAERTVPGLESLLPVEVNELESGVSLEPLNDYLNMGGEVTEIEDNATITNVTLKPGATALDDAQLVTLQKVGAGQVVYTAFDLALLRTWMFEPMLWQEVIDGTEPVFAPAAVFRWRSSNLLRMVLQLPELDLPSFGILALFITIYVVTIGPLNFFLLRRFKRIDLAWITIPLTVLLFIVGTYTTGLVLRGTTPQLVQVNVVQHFEGSDLSQATSFIGIFSPQRNTYTLEMAPNTLVSIGRFDTESLAGIPLTWTDNSTELRDLLVDVSSLRTFTTEQTLTANVQVSSDLTRNDQQVQGTIENRGASPLAGALVVSGNSFQSLGTIAPGESASIDLELGQDNFPFLVGAETEGLFNQQDTLNSLFDPSVFLGGFAGVPAPNAAIGQGVLDVNNVYLLSWENQPLVDAGVVDTTSIQNGLTLHVTLLREGITQ